MRGFPPRFGVLLFWGSAVLGPVACQSGFLVSGTAAGQRAKLLILFPGQKGEPSDPTKGPCGPKCSNTCRYYHRLETKPLNALKIKDVTVCIVFSGVPLLSFRWLSLVRGCLPPTRLLIMGSFRRSIGSLSCSQDYSHLLWDVLPNTEKKSKNQTKQKADPKTIS